MAIISVIQETRTLKFLKHFLTGNLGKVVNVFKK